MVVPPLRSLRQTLCAHPALKRWAKLFRPYGTRADPLRGIKLFPRVKTNGSPGTCRPPGCIQNFSHDDVGPERRRTDVIVTEILDAARRSASSGRTIRLDPGK